MLSSRSTDFAPRDLGERLAAALLRALVRLTVKPILAPHVPIAWQRNWLAGLTRWQRRPRCVEIKAAIIGDIRGEWARPANGSSQRATILYLHGGGYCVGSPAMHRAVTARLARSTGLSVFAADYRLAPEYPFPAAVDDAVAAYRSLRAVGPVAIAGDSAGAGLALATALLARRLALEPPVALTLFSPWVDLASNDRGGAAASRETVLSDAWLNACSAHYLAGADSKAALASPLYAELHGLPPVLIIVAADELLHGEAIRLDTALRAAGVTARCDVLSSCWHGFQLHAGMLRAANTVLDRAGRFICEHAGA